MREQSFDQSLESGVTWKAGSVKVYQVLGVDLVGIEHHKDLWVPGVIHTAVIQIHVAPIFGRRSHVFGVSIYVIPN